MTHTTGAESATTFGECRTKFAAFAAEHGIDNYATGWAPHAHADILTVTLSHPDLCTLVRALGLDLRSDAEINGDPDGEWDCIRYFEAIAHEWAGTRARPVRLRLHHEVTRTVPAAAAPEGNRFSINGAGLVVEHLAYNPATDRYETGGDEIVFAGEDGLEP